jgi:hypothetical protein
LDTEDIETFEWDVTGTHDIHCMLEENEVGQVGGYLGSPSRWLARLQTLSGRFIVMRVL